MEKIVILGSSGAGKSTLARRLGSLLQIKVFHLDRLLWQHDWKEYTEGSRVEIMKDLIIPEEVQWIIEGNYLRFSAFHVNAADTIIFLDLPSLVCFWHQFKRHYEYYRCPRYDIPDGCTDKLTFRRIWKVLTFQFHGKRIIKQTLHKYNYKHIIRLHSIKELEDFLARKQRIADDKSKSSNLVPPTKEKILAIRHCVEPAPLLNAQEN